MSRSAKHGRPALVTNGRPVTVHFGDEELRILARQRRHANLGGARASDSSLVRHLLHAGDAGAGAAEVRHNLQMKALYDELQRERRHRDAAEKRARRAEEKKSQADGFVRRLLVHLPLVRDRVASGMHLATGRAELDQMWASRGRSWPRVLAALEELAKRVEPPPDGGTQAASS